MNKILSLFNETDRNNILSIPISAQDRKGCFWWIGENNGVFSVKRCYCALIGEMQVDGWDGWKQLWDLEVPPKFKFFAWQVLDGSLPTVDNLRKKGVEIQNGCKLCVEASESLDHAMRLCPWSVKCGCR
ncbi:unnamed protein product [Cuscuta europaea]|uniref:Reverse transcriptase zinc-binding domain-containing protein n=1 Tax=Cuscuta europaea TaxID=41803 RepID=A0A9P0YXE9_CUSEU|nr:unnamed protein product [Cuscuta europaea]